MFKTGKFGGLFLVYLILAAGQFFILPKENSINHSRLVSIATSIDAFHSGFPLYTSNQHIYKSIKDVSKEYERIYSNAPQYEPIETTWEDPGYFYWVDFLGRIEKFFLHRDIEMPDLHIVQFALIILCGMFAFFVARMVDVRLQWVCIVQLVFLIFTRSLTYSLIGHYAYPLSAFFLFYLLVGSSFVWNHGDSLNPAHIKNLIGALLVGGLFSSLIRSIRADAGAMTSVLFISAVIILIAKNFRSIFKAAAFKWASILILLLALMSVPWAIKTSALNHREKTHPTLPQTIEPFVGAHPFWISAYTGFGYLPNSLGFIIKDEDAISAVLNDYGPLLYMTSDFENALREITIKRLKSEPSFLFKTIAWKIFDLFRLRHPTIPLGGLRGFFDPLILFGYLQIAIAFGVFFGRLFRERIYYLGLVVCLAGGIIPALIREPLIPYSGLFNTLIFMHVLMLLVWYLFKQKETGRLKISRLAFPDLNF